MSPPVPRAAPAPEPRHCHLPALGMGLQALHSHINILLWKIKAKQGPRRTSAALAKGTLGFAPFVPLQLG